MLKSVPGRLVLLGVVVALAGVYALTQMQPKADGGKLEVHRFARRPVPGRSNVALLQVDRKLNKDVLVSRGKRMPAAPVEASAAAAPSARILSPAPASVQQRLANNAGGAKPVAHAPAVAVARSPLPIAARVVPAPRLAAAASVKPRPAPASAHLPLVHAGMVATPSVSLPKGGHPVKQAMNVTPDPEADFGITVPAASQYSYNPDNRRDPFQTLLRGEFEGEHGESGQPLVDIADLRLKGVLNKANEYFAMVEDSKQHGFTLRVGDPVLNGRVTQIDPQCITVNLSSYGESQTVKLHLKKNNSKAGE